MDDDSGMSFQKKQQIYDQPRKIEYSGGGGGGGKPYSVSKTSFFSRTCYSDPNNPGKMICKNQSSGNYFDGNKSNEFHNESPEEVYETHTHNNVWRNFSNVNNNFNGKDEDEDNEDNFIKRMHYRIKNFFFGGSGGDDGKKNTNDINSKNNVNPYSQNNNPYINNNPYTNYNQHPSNNYSNPYQQNPYFNTNRTFFNNNQGYDPFFSNDPYRNDFDDIDKIFQHMVSSIFRDPYIGNGFFNDPYTNSSNNFFRSEFSTNSDPFFNRNPFPPNFDHNNYPRNDFPTNSFGNNFPNHNGFYNNNNNFNNDYNPNFPTPGVNNQKNYFEPTPSVQNNIKYRDHKIYDV